MISQYISYSWICFFLAVPIHYAKSNKARVILWYPNYILIDWGDFLFSLNLHVRSYIKKAGVLLNIAVRTEHLLNDMHMTPSMVYAIIISNLDTLKASGPESNPRIVLNKCAPKLAPVVSKLYNKCITAFCWLEILFYYRSL